LGCLYLVDTLVNVVRYALFAVVYVYLFTFVFFFFFVCPPFRNPLYLFNKRFLRVSLLACKLVLGALLRVLALGACEKHHYLLPRPHVLNNRLLVYVRLQRLVPRLVLLRLDSL
jgi:hypothetical protein